MPREPDSPNNDSNVQLERDRTETRPHHVCILSASSASAVSKAPPGIRPSFSSFSNRVISCKLFASRIIFSTRFRSASVNLTRTALSPCASSAAPPEGTSKVRDLMPMILDARAEGSLAVPKSSCALVRSTSFTFW